MSKQKTKPLARATLRLSILTCESRSHVEAIGSLPRCMRSSWGFVLALVFILIMPTPIAAHETKEFTIILHDSGHIPENVHSGVVFDTDSLFFRNEDTRESAEHRILIDTDEDGSFEGVDDITTGWLKTSCELNETGDRLDSNCQVAVLVSLAAEDGLLPGNISALHQIMFEGEQIDIPFFVELSPDIHTDSNGLPTGSENLPEDVNPKQSVLEFLIFTSALVGFFVAAELLKSDEEE
jgi:hypothetical protein